jgi:hypothetical protein
VAVRFVSTTTIHNAPRHSRHATRSYNQPRQAMRRPDLLHLRSLADRFGLELRVIALSRGPQMSLASTLRRSFLDPERDCVSSAVRRKIKGGNVQPPSWQCDRVLMQARIVQSSLVNLCAQLTALGDDAYRVVRYEDLRSENVEALAAPLLRWLDLDATSLDALATTTRCARSVMKTSDAAKSQAGVRVATNWRDELERLEPPVSMRSHGAILEAWFGEPYSVQWQCLERRETALFGA